MKRWTEIESEARAQENPPEDVLDSLRELWAIVVVFRANIFQLGRQHLCQLDHESLWTKIFMLIWNRGIKKQEANTVKLRYQPRKFTSLGGTLDALEKRLIRAQNVLDEQLRLADQGDQGHRERENREFLQNIHAFGSSPSLACLQRICTISSPTRFSISSQDISEMYANKISRLVSQWQFLIPVRLGGLGQSNICCLGMAYA